MTEDKVQKLNSALQLANDTIAELRNKLEGLELNFQQLANSQSGGLTTGRVGGVQTTVSDVKNVSLADIPLFADYVKVERGEEIVDWESFKRLFGSTLRLALRNQPAKDKDLIGYTALQKAGKETPTFKNILKAFVPDPENPPDTDVLLKELEGFYRLSAMARETLAKEKFDLFEFDLSKNLKQLGLAYMEMLAEVTFEGYVPSDSDQLKKLIKIMKGTELQQRILDHLDEKNLTAKGILERMAACAKTDELTGSQSGTGSATNYLTAVRKGNKPSSAHFGKQQGQENSGKKPGNFKKNSKAGTGRDKTPDSKQDAKGKQETSDTCTRCGKSGHAPKDGKFKDKTCHNCKKTGHTKAMCWSKGSEVEQANMVQEFAVLSVHQAMKSVKAEGSILVDSGDTKPLMPPRFDKFIVERKPYQTLFNTGNGPMQTKEDATYRIPLKTCSRKGKKFNGGKERIWIKVKGARSEIDSVFGVIPPSDDLMFKDGEFRQRVQLDSGKEGYLWGKLKGTLPIFEVDMDACLYANVKNVGGDETTAQSEEGWTVVKSRRAKKSQVSHTPRAGEKCDRGAQSC